MMGFGLRKRSPDIWVISSRTQDRQSIYHLKPQLKTRKEIRFLGEESGFQPVSQDPFGLRIADILHVRYFITIHSITKITVI